EQEREADRFAADWLLDGAPNEKRVEGLVGILAALLWIAVRNVFFGAREPVRHPNPGERLYQLIDHALESSDDDEALAIWHFVERWLFIHMGAAGYTLEEARMQGSRKEVVNYYMDELAKPHRVVLHSSK